MPIGTAAAIAIGLGTAVGQTATSIYGTKKSGDVNRQALQAQERGDVRADAYNREELALQREIAERQRLLEEQKLADARAARQAAMDMDRQRWTDYININRPNWDVGRRVLGNLQDLAGYSGGGRPSSAPIQAPAMPGSGPAPAGASFGTDARMSRGMSLADLAALGTSAPAARASRRSYGLAMPFPQVSTPRLSLQDLMLMTPPSASAARVG